MKRLFLLAMVFATGLIAASEPHNCYAKDKKEFTLAVSIYAGWMPWYYANEEGILKKWADKNGISIKVQYMDYIPSVEAYVAGKADAAVMTNMEALDMPAAAGIDTTAIIMGDFSNGNDAILTRDGITMPKLKGQEVSLVQFSVSHYLLVRALQMNGMKESDVQVVNTSDSDIGPVFIGNKSQKAVVTWNPIVMNIEQTPGVTKIFDSSKIPGEILDLCVVNTKVLKDNPALADALVGAWYEVLGIMSQRGPQANDAMSLMAKLAGGSLSEYQAQLRSTAMFWTPEEAISYTAGSEIKEKMDFVRKFCFEHKLLGERAENVDIVGIQYPDGSVQGDKNNIKLRFDTSFMSKAAKSGVKQ